MPFVSIVVAQYAAQNVSVRASPVSWEMSADSNIGGALTRDNIPGGIDISNSGLLLIGMLSFPATAAEEHVAVSPDN